MLNFMWICLELPPVSGPVTDAVIDLLADVCCSILASALSQSDIQPVSLISVIFCFSSLSCCSVPLIVPLSVLF